MKTFKVIICAMFILCCGALFSACGTKNFNEDNITIGEHTFVYDGKAHIVDVQYKGVKAKVSYAFEDDKNNFKSAEQLNLVNAGTYNLYYRLSADGYETYTSNGTLELTIQQKDLLVTIQDYNLIKSGDLNFRWSYTFNGTVEGDVLKQKIVVNDGFNKNNLVYGEEYNIGFTTQNPNYNVVLTREAKLTVTDYVQIDKGNGETLYFGSLQEAINGAEANDVLLLNDDITLTEGVEVTKPVVIDGRNQFTVRANHDSFEATEYAGKTLSSLFNIFDRSAELTLKDVVIDGSKITRGVSVFHGKLVVDNATITNGKNVDRWRSGGVYITNDSSFVMTSGSIFNNDANDSEYTRFCADLWVGANAIGSLVSINGGRVDSVFVNSNSYSALGAGKFTLDGGNIYSIYVEYDAGYGAMFEYLSGNVDFLMVSLPSADGVWGNYAELEPVENTTYIGGVLEY